MSFLISPQAGPMLAAATPDSPVQKLVAVAQVYSSQSPQNENMAAMVQAIRAQMKNPPPPPRRSFSCRPPVPPSGRARPLRDIPCTLLHRGNSRSPRLPAA